MSMLDGIEQVLMAGLALFVGVILLVFFLRRLLWWMGQRGWIFYTGDPPTYGTLGNAFLELQALAQPEVRYVLEEKQEEDSEEDGEAGPDDPVRHLRREMERIDRETRNRE